VGYTLFTHSSGGAARPTSRSATRYASARGRIVVSQADLAGYLGVTAPQVVSLWRQGVLRRVSEDASDYDLREAVRAYIDHLRRRGSGRGEAEREVLEWRAANLRAQNRDWRLAYGRQLGAAIVAGLEDAMARLRARLADVPGAQAAIDDMAAAIARTDVDAAAREAEGGDGEEDDGL